ncbi:bifunctional [glutamate--ammonia ligase]-adenylyl-L-tyrosine phosphorylase/[glutamate--ammonia-ligase] adenylyltransferase [Kangiella sediminilitoris]|uniref:Bifunctional glutamine synthetase adenylyltransferase/adenylyl-removing enzyme n=1 Tax=Kangiella sediminilitoris TaxID=1144748 RepID=A0A1B3B8P3_9GAMM|nr:bifunctional [glutamate--ammonia ligase]-adenylyl-L-tyrosine phosphorylase/[glutamate--ammonia-ligase] adenylyltransferase [Kangiella sediminilitoris]AOE49167.1 Glutamate-ammonia-ligase adenylyltransferase [Kangiella sediminilitoris]
MKKNLKIPAKLETTSEQRFSEWQQAVSDDSLYDAVLVTWLLTASDYIYRWAIKYPQWLLDAIEAVSIEQGLSKLPEEFELSLTEFDMKQRLRQKRHYWSVIIAVQDILDRIDIKSITFYQSTLADILIQAAYRWSEHQLHQQYGVPRGKGGAQQELLILAMGKLGGRELNFSSDIDLIFTFPEDGETDHESRPIENQKFFVRLGQKLISLLSDITYDGFVYRVDMRLRPYGQSGALVANFNALQDYYVEQGREWERFAMIKARVLNGHDDNRAELESIIRPFSYRRYIDFSVLESIRQLKQKIASELLRKDTQGNIKLGDGGIRELEFIVQSLQLISGGRYPVLQTKNWWNSLDVLKVKELLPVKESHHLKKAYEFLRVLENALQIHDEKQTQELPVDKNVRAQISIMMGATSWDDLTQELEQHQSRVAQFFKGLFHDPHEEEGMDAEYEKLSSWIEGDVKDADKQDLLEQFKITEDMVEDIKSFRSEFSDRKIGSRGLTRLDQLLPHLLIETASQPEPNMTLQRCTELLRGIGRRTAYFEMLAENLPVLEYLVQLVSQSRWLAKQMSIYPSLLDELLFPSNLGKQLSKDDLANQLRQALIRIELDDIEEQLIALGGFKQASQFKIAAGDLTGRFDISAVSQQLTDLAEVIVDYLLQLAWRETVAKFGAPPGCEEGFASGFLVLGYGKLGGDELGYGSDLDLVFLYQGDPQTQTSGRDNSGDKALELHQFYTRLAQRLVHYLSTRTQQGIMYEVDTRLRPSGRSGMLVSHIDAFKKYQHNEAWTWEHQALVRARPVTGDEPLKNEYMQLRGDILSKSKPPQSEHDDLAKDVVKMRQKMRKNLDKTDSKLWDIKQGLGGLVDIEFLVQYWALKHSRELVNKLSSFHQLPFNNVDWLQLLAKFGFIDNKSRDLLVDCYRVFRQISNHNALQNQPSLIDKAELNSEREQVLNLWDSTFEAVNVQ